MNNFKHSLKVTGIAALVMLGLVVVLIVGINISIASSSTSDATAPTSIPAVAPTATIDIATLPSYQLAAIDGVDSSDTATVAKYQTVLDSLHNKTGSSEKDIASMTYAGQNILTKDGYPGSDDSMIGLMHAADTSIPTGIHMKYADVLGALITLMENPQ